MHSGEEYYRKHFHQAFLLYRSSRFEDAAKEFEQASRVPGISVDKRLKSLLWYGASLYIGGMFSQALALFSEIYLQTKNDRRWYWESYEALHFQVAMLLILQSMDRSKFDLNEILNTIEKGLQWLDDIGHKNWGSHLLLDKAEVLYRFGRIEESLDYAEKAYHLIKGGNPGWYQGSYIRKIALYARTLGDYDHAYRVLSEVNESINDPHTLTICLAEEIEIYLVRSPPEILNALDVAHRIIRLCDKIQSPRNRIDGYGSAIIAFLHAQAWEEAIRALDQVMAIILYDKSEQKRFLELKVCKILERSRNQLNIRNNSIPHIIQQKIDDINRIVAEDFIHDTRNTTQASDN